MQRVSFFTKQLEKIGRRLNFPEALLELLTALGANTSEFSSAFVAIFSNNHEVSVGVILGSNIVNLAGLLGLSTIISGRITLLECVSGLLD